MAKALVFQNLFWVMSTILEHYLEATRDFWIIFLELLTLTIELKFTNKGSYKIVVRTTDKTGKVQTAEVREPFPNRATGYHMVDVQAWS